MSEPNPEKLNQFIERIVQRPMPQSAMGQIRTIAKEMAEGASEELWGTVVYRAFRDDVYPMGDEIGVYLEKRWAGTQPGAYLLISNGFLQQIEQSNLYGLTKAAFDLIEEVELSKIFISYRRKESSAFALLVLARLKTAGLEPFLDLSLVPGEDWEAGLRGRIQKYDTLIALIGHETLTSEVCLKELTWALEGKLTVIPIWHNGFTYKSEDWKLPEALDNLLGKTHTIRVIEESALGYNNAIVEIAESVWGNTLRS